MGKDGPILNPTNISYLAPSDVGIELASGGSAAIAGLSGLTLVSSVAAARLSAATLIECRLMKKGIQRIESQLDLASEQLTRIEERVERIDTKVAESHLREAIKHISERAIHADGIDLTEFARLARDIQSFRDALGSTLLFNFSVQLASDVRDRLAQLLDLVQHLRAAITREYNRNLDGDPFRSLSIHPIEDYLPCSLDALIEFSIASALEDSVFEGFTEKLKEEVNETFFFAGEEDLEKFENLSYENCYTPQAEALAESEIAASGLLLKLAAYDVFPDLEFDENGTESKVRDLLLSWFANSDSAILYKLGHELHAIDTGYEASFYPQLKDGNIAAPSAPRSARTELLFSCENTPAVA
jgi:hypothetical protein